MLGFIVVLLCASLYFTYKYFALKRHSHINNEVIKEMKQQSADQVKEQFQLFSKNVNETGGNLAETGEYASEKADIVRAAIDEVDKGLQKQLIGIEESSISYGRMAQVIEDLSMRSNQISEQSNTTLELTQEGNEKLKWRKIQ